MQTCYPTAVREESNTELTWRRALGLRGSMLSGDSSDHTSYGLLLLVGPPPFPGLWPPPPPQERSGMAAEPFSPPVSDSSPSVVAFSDPAGTGAPCLRNLRDDLGQPWATQVNSPLSFVPSVTTAKSPLPSKVTRSRVGSRDWAVDIFGAVILPPTGGDAEGPLTESCPDLALRTTFLSVLVLPCSESG